MRNYRRSIISLLRHINSLPIDGSLRHFYPLASRRSSTVDLRTAQSWDCLRAEECRFLIPDTRAEWQRMCETHISHDGNVRDDAAAALLGLMRTHSLDPQLYSFGVGLGALEYRLKRLDGRLEVYCSDFSAETVMRLRRVFEECDGIVEFDLVNDDFAMIFRHAQPRALALLHRIDPHLSDSQWKGVFARMRESGVHYVCFVPHKLLTLRYALEFKALEWRHRLRGSTLGFTGHVRTKKRLMSLWADSFELIDQPLIGRPAFLLQARGAGASCAPVG